MAFNDLIAQKIKDFEQQGVPQVFERDLDLGNPSQIDCSGSRIRARLSSQPLDILRSNNSEKTCLSVNQATHNLAL